MNILHVNSYFRGSPFYKNLYDKQTESGLKIDVFVPVSSAQNIPQFDFGEYTCISINHDKYDRIFYKQKQKKIYNDLLSKYDTSKYSCTHAHSLFTNGYIAMKLKERYGTPYIVAVRNTDVNVFFKYMLHLKSIGVKILENAENVIFLSKPYKDKVIEDYVSAKIRDKIYEKSLVIPNGIDDFWINNINVKADTTLKEQIKLLYVGVINKNKNIVATAKAIKVLLKEGFNISLSIVGGIEDQSIYNYIKDLPFVSYIQQKTKEELLQIYRKNDIFLMPSIYESFGLVYAEAMSQGLPVIYTSGQGFDGQFKDGEVGYAVNCFDPSDISEKIKKIIQNYKLLSKNCTKKVNKFNWSTISQEYSSMYTLISNQNRGM